MLRAFNLVGFAGCLVGRGFDPQPQTTLGKLFAHMCLCHQAVNLTPVIGRSQPAAGKVTVGLALHWLCVRDFSGFSAYGFTAYKKEMNIPPGAYNPHTLPHQSGKFGEYRTLTF